MSSFIRSAVFSLLFASVSFGTQLYKGKVEGGIGRYETLNGLDCSIEVFEKSRDHVIFGVSILGTGLGTGDKSSIDIYRVTRHTAPALSDKFFFDYGAYKDSRIPHTMIEVTESQFLNFDDQKNTMKFRMRVEQYSSGTLYYERAYYDCNASI